MVQSGMETEYIQTEHGLIERDFGYNKPHKYGTEFSSGRSTLPELDIKYIRITNKEEFLNDYGDQLPEFDIISIVAMKNDGSIKLFRPDDMFDFQENLRIPNVRTYATSFAPDFSSFDYYYVPQNDYQYNIWAKNKGLPRLDLPKGVHPYLYAVKIVDNEIISHKRYGFSVKRNALSEIEEYLHSGDKVQAGGRLYEPINYSGLFSFI